MHFLRSFLLSCCYKRVPVWIEIEYYLRSRFCCYTTGGEGRGGGQFQEYKKARRGGCSACRSSGIEATFWGISSHLVTNTAICVRCFELGSVRRPIVPEQFLPNLLYLRSHGNRSARWVKVESILPNLEFLAQDEK